MCKSLGSSIAAFFTTAVAMGIVLAISRKPEHLFIVILLLTISLIQLADAAIWVAIKNNSKQINLFITKYVVLAILITEWLVSYYGVRYFFGWSNRAYEVLLWFAVIYVIYTWIQKCKATRVYTDGYLRWCDRNGPMNEKFWFLFFLIFPILMGYPNILLKWVIVGLMVITFTIQIWYDTFGSRWCWIANPASVFVTLTVAYQKIISM